MSRAVPGPGIVGTEACSRWATEAFEFHGATVSSDAGLFPVRDLDDTVQLTESAAAELLDFRTGRNVQHSMTALLRQSVYSRLAGYEDVTDADRLSVDPVMRQVVGNQAITRSAASTSPVGRFETEVLAHPDNLATLMAMPGAWVDRVRAHRQTKTLILDLDSSVSKTYGDQEGSAYNGHFRCECYHPLFCLNQFGDVERALLRNGNVASAHDWRLVLMPIIARYRDLDLRRFFRSDAAFAIPELYEVLEAEGYLYAIRLKGNEVLYREIEFRRGVRWADRRIGPSSGITTSLTKRAVGTSRGGWWRRSSGTRASCSRASGSS